MKTYDQFMMNFTIHWQSSRYFWNLPDGSLSLEKVKLVPQILNLGLN